MIKLGLNSAMKSYQPKLTEHDGNNMENEHKLKGSRITSDYYEISSEAKEMFKASKEMKKNSYDISKVMAIHEKGFKEIPTKEESDYYWAARKSNRELDSYLYEKDKAEVLNSMMQVQAILLKIRSGKALTAEEEKMVKNDPILKQEIQMQKIEANMFK